MSKIISLLLVFLYLFPLTIPRLFFDSFYFFSLCGIIYICGFNHFKLNNLIFQYFILSLLVVSLAIIPITANQVIDFNVPNVGIKMVCDIFCAIFVVESIKKIRGRCNLNDVLVLIVNASVLQAIFSLLMFLFPDVQSVVINTIAVDTSELMQGFGKFRLVAIGKIQYANMACVYGFALMCLTCIVNSRYKTELKWPIIKAIIIILAGILSARSFFLLLLLNLCLYSFYSYKHNGFKAIIVALKLLILSVGFIAVIIAVLEKSDYAQTLEWAFEWYYNLKDNGSLETTSTDSLQNMYIFKDSLFTFFFGDGRLSGENGGFHMHTDVGLLRAYYAWGFFGALAYYLIIFDYYKIAYRAVSGYIYRALFSCMILWIGFYQIKEFWQMSLFWPLFLYSISIYKIPTNTKSPKYVT